MTCPHCGAYSPKNTSICNRCGRRLPLLETQRQQETQNSAPQHSSGYVLPEHEGYGYGYRQPEPTRFQRFLEGLGTFLDDIIEDPIAKKGLLIILAVVALVALVLNLSGACSGCSSCAGCSDCSGCSNDTVVSSGDVIDIPVSSTDASSTDVSSTDADTGETTEKQ